MKKKLEQWGKQALTAFLAVALIVGFVPLMGAPVHAAEGAPAIAVGGDSVLKATANTDKAQTISYAGVDWRVISYDGTGNQYTNPSGMMTLLSSHNLKDNQQFNKDWNAADAQAYAGSDLQTAVDGLYDSMFSEREMKAVEERTLAIGEFSKTAPYSTGVSQTATSGYLWPLSTAEALSLPSDKFRDTDHTYWLRSPGDHPYDAAEVSYTGEVSPNGVSVSKIENSVRAAFNLNLGAVLFASAVDGSGKYSASVGADGLTSTGKNTSAEWKLTLLDNGTIEGLDGHSDFKVTEAGRTEDLDSVTVSYSGATVGDNEYISAIITDKPATDPTAKVIYYGKIKNVLSEDDASGTITINTEGKLGDRPNHTDTLYVFNEQCNADETRTVTADGTVVQPAQADFASGMTEIVLPPVLIVTFENGFGKVLKTQRVEKGKGATAPEDPRVDGYSFQGWDTDFSVVTEDMTVNATWELIPPPPSPKKNISGILIATMKSKGSTDLALTWTKVNDVDGYDIFISYCNKDDKEFHPQFIKTVFGDNTLKWTKEGLNKKSSYKAYVKAWIMKDGKKKYVRTSPIVHAGTTGGYKHFTNSKSVKVNKKSVTLKVGKKFKIKAKVKKLKKNKELFSKEHGNKLRYVSSDKKIATVTKSGKIKAKAKGKCTIYVLAINGSYKKIQVTVK